jgi:hypothetical protein
VNATVAVESLAAAPAPNRPIGPVATASVPDGLRLASVAAGINAPLGM